jgi:phosphoenolpyruvate synthase/pyruvate phosphate dikinase
MDVPVPEFFVVGSHVFTDFCMSALEKDKEKLLEKGKNPENEEVQKSILSEEFSKEVQEDILSAYTRLSGFSDAWVSVRSSVVFPANDNISFSGIFSTELNV